MFTFLQKKKKKKVKVLPLFMFPQAPIPACDMVFNEQ